MPTPTQAYGALTEGFYLASFTFERAMGAVLGLLKNGGWRQVGNGFDDVNDFVRSLRFDQAFKVVADQRKTFVARVKELAAGSFPFGRSAMLSESMRARSERRGIFPRLRQKMLTETIERLHHLRDFPAAPLMAVATRPASSSATSARSVARRKLQSIREAAELKGLFSVIYADPPWQDEFGPNDRQAELHYPVMTLADIKGLPLYMKLGTPDAWLLYLWALPAHDSIGARGHEQHGASPTVRTWVWVKDKIGLGEWVRQQHEVLLIGRRGGFPPPPTEVRSPSVVNAPRGEHSAKPAIFAEG